MSYYEVIENGNHRYAGWSLDVAATAFEELARLLVSTRSGFVVLLQDGHEVQAAGA